ncbi:MAG: SusC/RagA family TonB-linked outer membrane protein [Saprospiraceae bacterium]
MLTRRLAHWILVFGLVAGLSLTAYGQQLNFTISGTVLDDSSTPLIGVTIFVPSLGAGTLTDLDGRYELKASGTAGAYRAEFSYVGYTNETRSFDLSGNDATYRFDVTLGGDALNLDEVVVTGSSTTSSRRQLGNAVNSIRSDRLNNAAPTSVSGALQGKIAGAQITQNSGDPAGGFSIRLRGASTLSGSSEPLYVIDGVIISNSTANVTNSNVSAGAADIGTNRLVDINPNDIERLETINGAAAAAIYGSRASNGVVLITTKRGSSGKPKFTYSSSFNVNELRKRVPFTTFGKQFGSVEQRLYTIAGADPVTGGLTVGSNFSTDLVDVTRYDYQDDIFRTGTGADQFLSVSGGNEQSNYYASANYLYNEGIIRNADFRRYGARLRYNQTVTSWASFSVGLNYTNSFSNEKPDGNVFWSPINSINITNNIYDISERDAVGNLQAVEPTRINPLSIIETFDLNQEVNRVITDVQVKLFPFEGFSVDYILGVDAYSQLGNTYMPPFPYSGVNPGFFDDGYAATVTSENFRMNHDINARYEINLGESITSTTQAGATNQFAKVQTTVTGGRGLAPFVETVNGASTILEARSNISRLQIWGYYLQQTFGFANKFFLTAAGRIDGASSFSPDNRSIFYPKVSGSYLISEENWWENSIGNAINTMRLRASWGKAGNLTGIGAYDRFNNYGTNQFLGLNSINASSTIANPDVKPEIQTELEFGLDLAVLNERVGIGFTYYNQNIEDLLLTRQIAASAGGTSTTTNVGEMENNGIELTISANIVRQANFSWNVFGNYSRNRNEITSLGQDQFQIPTVTGAPVFLVNGEPIGVFFGTYQATNADGSILETPDGLRQRERADRGADGQPTGEILRRVIGDPNPDYTFGLGSEIKVGNFGFNFLIDGVQGVDVFDADKRTRQGVGVGDIAERELRGDLPRGWIWSIYPIEEWRISDGSYVKIREVSLNYTFPSLFGGKLNNTMIALSGRNLVSFDSFTSYDPEVNSGGSSNLLRAVNFGTVPIPRTYTLTLRSNF